MASGLGFQVESDIALDAIVHFGHGLHVVGLQQVERIDGTQVPGRRA